MAYIKGLINQAAAIVTALTNGLNNSGTALPATTSLYDALTPKFRDVMTSHSSPAQNQYKTIYSGTNCVLNTVAIGITSTNEDLSFRVTIDGMTITGTKAGAVAGHMYNLYLNGYYTNFNAVEDNTLLFLAGKSPLPARSVLIEACKTSAAGTGNLAYAYMVGER